MFSGFSRGAVLFFLVSWCFAGCAGHKPPRSSQGGETLRLELTENPWTVRQGFDVPEGLGVSSEPVRIAGPVAGPEVFESAPEIRLPPGSFPVRLNTLFGVEPADGLVEATLSTSFDLEDPSKLAPLGLLLPGMGENWEVYLNHRLVARSVHLSPDGRSIRTQHISRGEVFPLRHSFVQKGKNQLVIRLIGRAPVVAGFSNRFFGMIYRRGYYVGDLVSLRRLDSPTLLTLGSGFSLACALLFFVIYGQYRRPFVLSFAGIAVLSAVFYLTYADPAFFFVEDTRWLSRWRYVCLALFYPLYLLFHHDFFFPDRRFGFTEGLTIAVSVCFAVVFLFTPAYYNEVPLFVYQLLLPAFIVYLLAMIFRAWRRGLRYSSRLFFIALITGAFVVWDIMDSAYIASGIRLSIYSLFALVFAVALIIADLLWQLREALSSSERKYRRLVEGSPEIIFTLDAGGRILNINTAVHVQLGYLPERLVGSSFYDLIHNREDPTGRFNRRYFREQLQLAQEEGRAVEFRIELAGYTGDATEVRMRLEPGREGGGVVIFGRAASVPEDILGPACLEERQTYCIGNNFVHAEILARRLTETARHHTGDEQLRAIQIGLRELLINAIEHGNLEVSFEEKGAAQADLRYYELLRERQEQPHLRDRHVTVEYHFDPTDGVRYTIMDQGHGFDYNAMLQRDAFGTEGEVSTHGRGIALARALFDVVEYQGRGNVVVLRKAFRKLREMDAAE